MGLRHRLLARSPLHILAVHGRRRALQRSVTKFGVDIGYVSSAVIVWAVIAPTGNLAPGSLAGDYDGATASATIAVGLGGNVLVGGSGNTIALQPLNIEGNTGLNVASDIAAIRLQYQP